MYAHRAYNLCNVHMAYIRHRTVHTMHMCMKVSHLYEGDYEIRDAIDLVSTYILVRERLGSLTCIWGGGGAHGGYAG